MRPVKGSTVCGPYPGGAVWEPCVDSAGPRCGTPVAMITTAAITATTMEAGITTFLRCHDGRGRGGWTGGPTTAGGMPGVGGTSRRPDGEPSMVAACGDTARGGATSPPGSC